MNQEKNTNTLSSLLLKGCERLGYEPADKLTLYLRYTELLLKWNKVYNLTAVVEPEAIIERHILDSLSVLPFIQGRTCLDIGTGPGLPGMILAIALPQTNWVLLDSNHKKTRFLRHVIAELGISNVELEQSRAELYKPEHDFNTITCRAFAPLDRLLEWSQHLITKHNQLLAMKGKQAKNEIDNLSKHDFEIAFLPLQHVSDNSDANLIQIRRAE